VEEISAAALEDLNWRREQTMRFSPSCIDLLPSPFKLPLEYFFPPKDEFEPGPPPIRESPLKKNKKSLRLYLEYLEKEAPTLFHFFRKKLVFRIPEEARKMHTYIAAGAGGGKTELLKVMIHEYVRRKGYSTTIVIDPHGDFCQQISRWKIIGNGEDLVYIHPKLQDGFTPCINPLEMSRTDDPLEVSFMAECLTDVFRSIVASNDSSVTSNMGTLLKAVLFILLRKKDTTLLDLQRFMRDDQNRDLVEYAKKHCEIGQRDLFHNAFYDSNYTPTKRALYTKIQDLLTSQSFFNLTVGKSTIDLRGLMDSRKLVVFGLSVNSMGGSAISSFSRLLLGLIQGFAFQRQDTPEKLRVPTHVFIDEAALVVCPSIKIVLTQTRKFALHLTFAQQYFGQDLDSQLKDAISSSTAVKISGIADAGASLTSMSKMMTGVNTEELQNCRRGEFFIKYKDTGDGYGSQEYGKSVARKFFTPVFLLGNRRTVNDDEWEKRKAFQLQHYYRKIRDQEAFLRKALETPFLSDTTDPDEIRSDKADVPARQKERSALKPPLEL
jgi:hypothetical protein